MIKKTLMAFAGLALAAFAATPADARVRAGMRAKFLKSAREVLHGDQGNKLERA